MQQAGAAVLTECGAVLRRTPKGEYLFPKGHVEPGETLEETAVREVAEETGLAVDVVADLGEITFVYDGDEHRVRMFLTRVTRRLDEWDQHSGRDAVEVPLTDVRRLLTFDDYRRIWDRAEALIRLGEDGPRSG